jgi:ATP-dependent Clp protease ATP-binding subunit ClpX
MRPVQVCSFCGASELGVRFLLAGCGAFICDACVLAASETIAAARTNHLGGWSDPASLVARVGRTVVAQERAKRVLAVAVHNHYKRLSNAVRGIRKSNVLLIGPTGSGKTLLARTLAAALNVPFAIVDVTGLTQAGYVGDDVDSIAAALLSAAEGNVARAERGIVFLDEIDKLARRTMGFGRRSLDVSGEGVQQALLKIVDGTTIKLAEGRARSTELSTANVLFIAGGAFPDLPDIIHERVRHKVVGFVSTETSLEESEGPDFEDLTEFGMVPEFLGRFPIVCTLSTLSAPQLRKVLLDAENALIPEFQTLFALDGVDLRFDDEAVNIIARKAVEMGTGARALRSILEDLLTDAMFHAPTLPRQFRLVVTGDDVRAGQITQLENTVGLRKDRESDDEMTLRTLLAYRARG